MVVGLRDRVNDGGTGILVVEGGESVRLRINRNRKLLGRGILIIAAITIITAASTKLHAETGTCGGTSTTLPFVDVLPGNTFFCAIAEAYFSGLTNGTSTTTYNPADPVPREQMAAFVTRTMDQSIKRASRRAALDQFWTSQANQLAFISMGGSPDLVKSDGTDIWAANSGDGGRVFRVRASDGRLLETWTGALAPFGVLAAMGRIFVTGGTSPFGTLYQIDPTQVPGTVVTLTSSLGPIPIDIAYDGKTIWTANSGPAGSVSMVTLNPLSVTTVATGFSSPRGLVFDGENMWVTDDGDGLLKKLDSNGNILTSVPVGASPRIPAFDGTNLWVPGLSNTVSVVRARGALAGVVLAALSGNGLNGALQAAFDGERILVTNNFGHNVSLWRATDLTPVGSFSISDSDRPVGVCSDGLNFWITTANGNLARF